MPNRNIADLSHITRIKSPPGEDRDEDQGLEASMDASSWHVGRVGRVSRLCDGSRTFRGVRSASRSKGKSNGRAAGDSPSTRPVASDGSTLVTQSACFNA